MQSLSYTVGAWHALADIEEVEEGKLMAVISVTDSHGNARNSSKHTVVFNHEVGTDTQKETENLVRRLLKERYGMI